MKSNFYIKYHKEFLKLINIKKEDQDKLDQAVNQLIYLKKKKGKIIIFGNGGSSAIASHVAVDFIKNTRIKTIPLTDTSLITCFSNDFEHKNWMKKAIEHYFEKGDIAIIISSSGNSDNIINAAKYCVKNNIKMISFSGMKKKNKLNILNKDGINFWVNSRAYNHIELSHLYFLLMIVDKIASFKSQNKVI